MINKKNNSILIFNNLYLFYISFYNILRLYINNKK